MRNIVFVSPYFMDASVRFIDAVTKVPNTRVGLVSCDPVSRLSDPIRQRLAAHFAVNDISTGELMRGVRAIGDHFCSVDGLLGILEQIQVPLGEIRDQLGLPGMGAAASNRFRDKAVMKDVLRAAGVPCAQHHRADSIDSALSFAKQIDFPLIVKPPDGAGAKGTYRCEDMQQYHQCLQFIKPSADNPLVIEEFIVGQEHSFDSICLNGQMIWSSISHYSPGPLEVVREPWIQWCVMIPRQVDSPRYRAIQQYAPQALKALGMETGLSHMEWFLRKDGSIAISEVGARPPGAQFTSLVSWAHDFDLYQAWANLMVNQHFEIPERKFAAGAAYLRGMGSGTKVAHVSGLQKIANDLGDIVVEAKIPSPGQSASGSYEGEGHIIVRHQDTETVQRALRQIITTVQVNNQ